MSPSPMLVALAEAEAAAARGEVPVGAVLVDSQGGLLAADGNRVKADRDPTAHAEMLVLRAGAARLGAKRLAECDLYVTLEPCAMCAAAIALARLRRLYFGAYDPKGGAGAPAVCCVPFFAIDGFRLVNRSRKASVNFSRLSSRPKGFVRCRGIKPS